MVFIIFMQNIINYQRWIMRKYFMVFGLILFCVNLAGQTYYSRGSSNSYYLNYLASWSTNRDGTGLQPTSFSGAGKYFVVQNGHNLTATAQWTVDRGQRSPGLGGERWPDLHRTL